MKPGERKQRRRTMARLDENSGTIRKRRDGRWEGRITVGITADGKQKRRSYYGETKGEVRKLINSALQSLGTKTYVDPNRITVGEWLDYWVKKYAAPKWREKTLEVSTSYIRLHIKPALGKIRLTDLTSDHIDDFIDAEQKKGLAPNTIHREYVILHSALKEAVKKKKIVISPAEGVNTPKQEQKKEIAFLTVEEQRELLKVLPDTTGGRAIRFILCTGLRASELCGLQWRDIKEDCIEISRGAQYIQSSGTEEKRKLSVAPAKTKAGKRTIRLTASAAAIIREQKAAQREERLQAGHAWEGGEPGKGTTPVFATLSGTIYDRNNLARVLRTSLRAAGLQSRGLHALRHTFATNWVRAGADLRTLSDILGHTSVAFTMQQYVHSDMGSQLDGLQKVENLLGEA
jgi:integrase